MAVRLYHEYRLKFYLNAKHYIIINGHKGETHPHTWEFTLTIRYGRSSFVEFNTFEKGISDYIAPFQNRVMNEVPPFDAILPTLENMTDYLAEEFLRIIQETGGQLLQVEASETPTRSYILHIPEEDQEGGPSGGLAAGKDALFDAIDAVINSIVQ
ncbi:MAG: 6-pyruvoyl tetrahydrobiopterin synthase [Oscillibacter sp.]|jgi:6-pyruvoyltetrahydropterin/6-carboxytetrahydropterin synthase|nr:6-carboxytetrahydropterin synthase [uncultured Oscillibacter sp.]MCI9643574.1 6-pyruvoyl tetrahydrobiopterin synthase [Oscillibacter sp.]